MRDGRRGGLRIAATRRSGSRRRARAAGWIVLSGLLAGCTVAAPAPAPPPDTGPRIVARTGTPTGPIDRVTWAIPADVTTLDPFAARDGVTRSVLANVCESLLRFDADGTIAPGLAESERKSATEWVYTVRAGATFSDGTSVSAEDVAASLRRRLEPGSPWRTALADVESVEATDADSVTVTLTRANVLVDQLMATAAGVVVSRTPGARSGLRAPLCSGPYRIAARTPTRNLTLVRNDGYWDRTRVPLARQVVLRVIPSPGQRAAALVRGLVDGTYDPPAAAMAQLDDAGGVRVSHGRAATATSITVTDFTGPLKDLRLRRALSLGVDRAALAAAAPTAGAAPAKAPAAAGQWGATLDEQRRWFVNLPPVDLDVEASRRLVVEAKVPDREILLGTAPDAQSRATGERIRDSLVVTGLPMRVVPMSAETYAALLANPAASSRVDAYVASRTSDVPDPLQIYARHSSALRGDGAARIPGFDQGTYDEVYSRAAAEADRGRRLQLLDQLQKMVVAAHVDIPLYEERSAVVETARVTGAPAGFVRIWMPWAALIGASR